MKENLLKFIKQARMFYAQLTPGRRISLLIVLIASIAVFAIIIGFISHDSMQRLTGGLAGEEVQAVAKALQEGNIPCQISSSGDSILVPSSRIEEARLQLASAGLPRNGNIGFELFDRDNIGMTSFRERINFRRALEGELSRSIRSLSEVKNARVHIVLPRQALFSNESGEPSASVVINLHAGYELSKKQIKGIRFLVASAVEKLRPQRVTILDGTGAVLARMDQPGESASGDDQVEYQHALEQRMENRILNLIEPLVGAGKVVAQVTADIDFSHLVETSEEYDPDRISIRSEQHSSEKRTGGDSRASGVVGAKSNLPGGGPDRAVTGQNNFDREAKTINYEVDKKTRRLEQAMGRVKKLSVAVVIDGSYQAMGEGKEKKMSYKARDKAEMEHITNLVKKAIGFNAQRGDQVEVSNIAFQVQDSVAATPAWLERLDLTKILQILAMVALGLLLLFTVVRPVLRAVFAPSPDLLLPAGRPATVVELERDLMNNRQPTGLLGPSEPAADTPAAFEANARRLSEENPQRAVQVLRGWLNEDTP